MEDVALGGGWLWFGVLCWVLGIWGWGGVRGVEVAVNLFLFRCWVFWYAVVLGGLGVLCVFYFGVLHRLEGLCNF